eukprot:CAMPEP_0195117118 /NCGR_PEP_ID=MMETSP0448-20130528/113666_1 /TAXON_ID=66468 /ORGANISM="Heterocapsa triquestra, Strain CCMP 448" /LENGTH=60 /DNA_ID=CAMNT_0040154325 /DNA_START=103 /DNA_END=282 /DNA_ORIENTATION=+
MRTNGLCASRFSGSGHALSSVAEHRLLHGRVHLRPRQLHLGREALVEAGPEGLEERLADH